MNHPTSATDLCLHGARDFPHHSALAHLSMSVPLPERADLISLRWLGEPTLLVDLMDALMGDVEDVGDVRHAN
jgi:hypothetical protein